MPNEEQGVQPTQQPAQQAVDMAALTVALTNALTARTERAENGLVRSFAEQYGMSEGEIKQILADARKAKDTTPTAEQQKQINAALERANGMLISAEVKTLGAAMGLRDADVALSLLDRTKIKVGDDGKVEGVQDQLDALKKAKEYLFAAAEKPTRTGMRQAQGDPKSGKYDAANAALRAVLGKE